MMLKEPESLIYLCAKTAGASRMGTFRIAAVLLLLLALPRSGRAELPGVDARQLVRSVDTALAGAEQAAKDPRTGLDPRNSKYAPFWSALQALRDRVGRIEGSLAPRTDEFFLQVDEGSSDLGELRVAWARTGVKNAQVAEEIRIASASYRQLRAYYGREGLRQRQGAPLTAAERRQFQRLQQSERRLAERLRLLRDQARRRGDATTAAELERFRAEAERIALASADLSSYLNALIATGEMRGEWHANAPYIRKATPPAEWAAADETVQDLYVDSDIGQVFTVDLGAMPPTGAAAPVAEAAASSPEGAIQADLPSGQASAELVVLEPIATSFDEVSAPDDPGDSGDPKDETVQDIDLSAPAESVADGEAPAVEEKPEPSQAAAPETPPAPRKPSSKPAGSARPIPPPIG
jgi:cell division protein FtsB